MDPVVSTVLASLMAAIGVLWKKLAADHARITAECASLSARYDECQADREAIHEQLGRLKTDVAIFKTCAVADCGARQAFHRQQTFGDPELNHNGHEP
jgi:hypothetical protein